MKRKDDHKPSHDWRDPNMPVYANSQSRGMILLTPEYMQALANRRLEMKSIPDYHDDPTYNLRKPKP